MPTATPHSRRPNRCWQQARGHERAHLDLAQIPPSVTRIIIELHPGIIGEEATKRVINQIHFLGFHTRAVEENTWLFMR